MPLQYPRQVRPATLARAGRAAAKHTVAIHMHVPLGHAPRHMPVSGSAR
jgi:hypothetical protein